MKKAERARIILSQLRSLDRSRGRTFESESPYPGPRVRSIEEPGRWTASITRGARQIPGALPWDLLSVHAVGELVLSMFFRKDEIEIVCFRPGAWELWFETFDPLDEQEMLSIA